MMRRVHALAAVAATFALCPLAAHAAAGSDFYKGKQISLVINYTVGGPTDTEARLLARHLSKHIPGNPPIIVRNMGGAGGMIGINWLGQIAVPDGLTVGYVTGLVGAAQHQMETLRVDAAKFIFISGVEAITVAYARSDLGSGLKVPSDLMKQSDFWMGGLAPDGDKDLRLRAELDLLGLKYKYITGYTGAAEARLALEQKEIQMTAESLPTYRLSIEPALVRTGKAIPLWLDVAEAYAGKKHPDTTGIDAPTFEAYYGQMKGAPPKGNMLWDINELLKEAGTVFLRTINLPPNSPPEAAAILRTAVAELVKDEDYRRDAIRTIQYVPRFSMGPAIEEKYRRSLAPDPKIVAFIQDYIAKGKAMIGK
jgi:tripartite-type tricarboxylate transporter receptor subunit TctC